MNTKEHKITGSFKLNSDGRLFVAHDGDGQLSDIPWNTSNLIGPGDDPVVVGGRFVLQDAPGDPGWVEIAGVVHAKALVNIKVA